MRGQRTEKKTTTRTWEWKGTVCNIGVRVGGCSSKVLVIDVSIPCHLLACPREVQSLTGDL